LLLDFESANSNAQNAFLKTLEEPNPKVILIITVDDAENLLPTITSRCEQLRLRPMPVKKLAQILEQREGAAKEKAELIAHIAGGRVGYASRLIQDADALEKRTQWLDDLHTLLMGGIIERLQYSKKITRASKKRNRAQVKQDLSEGMRSWLAIWRDVLLLKSGSGVPITNIDRKEMVQKAADSVSMDEAAQAVRALEHVFRRIQSANLQLMLDNILLAWPFL